jgi:hypothetical protein
MADSERLHLSRSTSALGTDLPSIGDSAVRWSRGYHSRVMTAAPVSRLRRSRRRAATTRPAWAP